MDQDYLSEQLNKKIIFNDELDEQQNIYEQDKASNSDKIYSTSQMGDDMSEYVPLDEQLNDTILHYRIPENLQHVFFDVKDEDSIYQGVKLFEKKINIRINNDTCIMSHLQLGGDNRDKYEHIPLYWIITMLTNNPAVPFGKMFFDKRIHKIYLGSNERLLPYLKKYIRVLKEHNEVWQIIASFKFCDTPIEKLQ